MTIDEINDLLTEGKHMQLNFDASSIAPSTGGITTFLPMGDYPFMVKAVEAKKVKNKENEGYLEVTLYITDGPFKGAIHADRFNLWNASDQAKQIAYSQLSSLCRVTGRIRLQNDTDLIGGTGIATIGPQIENGELSSKYSEVKNYKDMQGRINGQGEPVAAPQPVAPAATAAPAGGSPWQNTSQQPQSTQQAPAQQPQQQMPWQTAAPAGGAPPANGWQTGGAPAQAAPAGGTAPPWATPQQ